MCGHGEHQGHQGCGCERHGHEQERRTCGCGGHGHEQERSTCGCGGHGHEQGHPACGCGERHASPPHHHQASRCGCTHHGGPREGGHAFWRRFATREERLAWLQQYLKDLRAEAQAVEERIAEMRTP